MNFADLLVKTEWSEGEHPRDETGRFTAGEQADVARRLDEGDYGQEDTMLARQGDPVFGSAADVDAWAKSRGISVEKALVDELGLEHMQVVAGTHDDLVAKYPAVEKVVTGFQIGHDGDPGCLMYADARGTFPKTQINFTPTFIDQIKSGTIIDDTVLRGRDPAWQTRFGVSGGELRDTIVHEYGHAMHNTPSVVPMISDEGVLKFAMRDAGWVYDDDVGARPRTTWDRAKAEQEYDAETNRLREEGRSERLLYSREKGRDADILMRRIMDHPDEGWQDEYAVARTVSRYGATSPRETFAEVFSMHNGDVPLEDRLISAFTPAERDEALAGLGRYRVTINEYSNLFGAGNIL